jgi:threonine dehydrogenase-like Zn-dependent dehydrogenase
MKALTWHGKGDMRCESVPDPKIEHPRDAIIKVTACAICGSDLHIYDGVIPSMESGDVLGHETMGEVIEVGAENKKLKIGDRVVVPFTIACGECFFCKRGFYSGCERSNPDRQKAEKLQFAIRSAFLLGAERVLAIDTVPERMALARAAGAQTLDFKAEDIYRS